MTDTTATENEAAAPGQLDDESLINEILANLKEGRRHLSNWRTHAREDYDFFAGVQWSEEDAAKLKDQNRPAVTFNRIARTINAVAGLELQNRQEVRYLPRRQSNASQMNPNGISDAGFGEMLTSASNWVREGCNAEDEESESFQDSLICGLGFTETRMDYEEDPEGKILIERIDPLEMVVDPCSKKRNFDDARWIAHVKPYTRKEIKSIWGEDIEAESNLFWNDLEGTPHNAQDAWQYENDQSHKLQKNNTVSVIRYQYWKRINVYKVQTPDGNLVELPEHRYEVLQASLEMQGIRGIKMPKRIYYQCFIVGSKFLEKPTEIGCNHFTLRGITGLRDRNANTWFGLVSLMKDPQRWANKWLSQIQHIINSNAKGGLLVETGAVQNMRKLEEKWSETNSVIELNPGGLEKIQQKESPRYPDGVDKLLQYAIQSINDVPGVNLELIGMAERDQPYVLEQTRKQAGITILATFFDSLRRYRKVHGRVVAYFIREYISDGRLVKVLGPEGIQYVPLIKDAVAFDYDIVVDDAPNSPNVKEKTFNALNQIVPMALQAGIAVPPDILDFAPLPENLIQKWKQLIAGQMKDPMQDQLKQLDMMLRYLTIEKAQADIQETSSKVTLNYSKAEQAHATGQDESAQAMQKMGMNEAEHNMKHESMMKEQARKDLEMMLTQRRKEIESKMNMKIKAEQARQQPRQTIQ